MREQNGIEPEGHGFWILKRVFVYIPKGRANEIPKVIEEHHKQEAQRHLIL